MKLHLGCGKKHLPGFINVDIDPANEPDVVADCFKLYWFGETWGVCSKSNFSSPQVCKERPELIYACHVLEHCGRHEYKAVLKSWFDLLKPGGILRLAVPNLEMVVAHYNEHYEVSQHGSCLDELLGFFYGGQRNEHDYHKMGWDEATLTRDLLAAGFSEVRRWDWRTTEHAGVDDYSQSFLPHISQCKNMEEYRKGVLMSLNIEAVK